MFLLAFQKKPSVRTCDTPGQLLLAEPWLRSLLNRKKSMRNKTCVKTLSGYCLVQPTTPYITRQSTTYGCFCLNPGPERLRIEGFDPFDCIIELIPVGSEEGPSYGEKKRVAKADSALLKRPRISDSLRSRPTNTIFITVAKDLDLISPPCYNYR